jgi:hypothetical protein
VNGNGHSDREEELEKQAQWSQETIAEMDSTDTLRLDQANRLEECIGREPEEMLSRLAHDDLRHGVTVTNMLDQIVSVCLKAADSWRIISTDEKNLRLQAA